MTVNKPKKIALLRRNRDIRDVSLVLRNLFKSGHIGASEILRETGNMLPQYQPEFHAGARQINQKGWSFSQSVDSLFPDSVMPAIRAGEESGNLDRVFDQIWSVAKIQEDINKVLSGLTTPLVLILIGIVICLSFLGFLVPFVYEGLANGAPQSYEPGMAIMASVAFNKFLVENWQLVLFVVGGSIAGLVIYISNPVNRDKLSDSLIGLMLRFNGFGVAYASLKFGIMAKYLEIVSMAGLDMEQRINLVVDTLPKPLQPGLKRFKSEMLIHGLSKAAKSEGRDVDDPRISQVFWPAYIRLAFFQAHETGDMEGSMREYGAVLVDEGKERIEFQIGVLNKVAVIAVGILTLIPVALLYGTMGEILIMRLRGL